MLGGEELAGKNTDCCLVERERALGLDRPRYESQLHYWSVVAMGLILKSLSLSFSIYKSEIIPLYFRGIH